MSISMNKNDKSGMSFDEPVFYRAYLLSNPEKIIASA